MLFFNKNGSNWQDFTNEISETTITTMNARATRNLIFLGIDHDTLKHRQQVAEIMEPKKSEVIAHVMERFMTLERVQHVVAKYADETTVRKHLETYLNSFLHDDFNQDYIESRLKIGQVQSKVHLTAEFFIPAFHLIFQYIQAVIIASLKRKPDDLANALLAVQKLSAFDLQLVEQSYFEDTNKYFFFRISEMINQITKLDTTENLIKGVDSQMEETHNVSAATEEMGASIQEVASSAVSVAENTDEAVQSAKESQKTISNSLNDIQQIGQVYEEVVSRVSHLENEIQQTKDVIEIIKGVADQTNLLALNASIEAARAGEHGKGFAVVASEVRKLSEHTNEQISKIESNMESLREVSIQVTEQIKQTASLVDKSVEGSKLAGNELEKIVVTMQDILHSTSQIAAMSEEQTSAVQDIAERSGVIYTLSQNTQEIAKETGQLIFDLSQEMEDYRNLFFGLRMHMTYEDIIKIVITDHLSLTWKIYNMMLGVTTLNPDELHNHTTCNLGQWYYGPQPERVRNMPEFKALEEPHRALHAHSIEAVRYLNEGNMEQARISLDKSTEAQEKVVELLYAMR